MEQFIQNVATTKSHKGLAIFQTSRTLHSILEVHSNAVFCTCSFQLPLYHEYFPSDFFRPLGIAHKPPTTTGITSTFRIAHILDITINMLLLSLLLLILILSLLLFHPPKVSSTFII